VVSVSGAHLSDYAVNDSYRLSRLFSPRIINFTLLISLRARGTADAACTWLNMAPVASIGNWHHPSWAHGMPPHTMVQALDPFHRVHVAMAFLYPPPLASLG